MSARAEVASRMAYVHLRTGSRDDRGTDPADALSCFAVCLATRTLGLTLAGVARVARWSRAAVALLARPIPAVTTRCHAALAALRLTLRP